MGLTIRFSFDYFRRFHAGEKGFSLLEMSFVLAIIAVITAETFSTGSMVIASSRLTSTNNKLDTIEEALTAFRLANNRLPCPGDATLADTSTNSATYGYEAGVVTANNPAGSCIGGSPAANFSYKIPANTASASAGTYVAEGAVPVKALGLPDEFQWDAWGHKFAYAVWTQLTLPNAFLTYSAHPSCGAITVEDAGGSNRTTQGAYALLSYGPDGHGGYSQAGGTTRYSSGSDNADELINCHCTSNLVGNPAYTATYVEQDPTQTTYSNGTPDPNGIFDDIVRYKNRWQLQNDYDGYVPNGVSCTPGFIVDGNTANSYSGSAIAIGDVNGDGIPDLVILAPGGGTGKGAIYVLFGTRDGFSSDPFTLNSASFNGSNGFEIDGTAAFDLSNVNNSIAVADVNGDGIGDIIVTGVSGGTQNVFIIYGQTSWTSPPVNFNFSVITSTATAPLTLATGDFNGDGIADILIGDSGYNGEGEATVVFGARPNGPAATGIPFLASSSSGISFTGTPGSATGSAVAMGDINHDGISDLVIGSNGTVYVVFGTKTNWVSSPVALGTYISSGGGSTGFQIGGLAGAVTTIATGDVNGDGFADLIFSTGGASAYAVFGGTSYTDNNTATGLPWATCSAVGGCTVAMLTGSTTGYTISGPAGTVISSLAAGDVNGDGISDVLVADYTNGNAYVLFGGSWTAPVTLGPPAGFEFSGISTAGGANEIYGIASGDLNGDGIADFVLGAAGNTGNAAQSGQTFIYFGHKSTNADVDPWPTTTFNLGGL